MKPIFTIHAGEYLAAGAIEGLDKDLRVWIPSKDVGIDLLVTDKMVKQRVSVQVKFSKDFYPGRDALRIKKGIEATGLFTLKMAKLKASPADLWVLIVPSFTSKQIHSIVIRPKELHQRIRRIHRNKYGVFAFVWISEDGKCWEVNGLRKAELEAVGNGKFKDKKRDFTQFLNNWKPLLSRVLK